MDINFSESVGAFLLFGIVLLSTFVSYRLLARTKNKFWISLSSGLVAGSILGVSFVNMLPNVRQRVLVYHQNLVTSDEVATAQVSFQTKP